MAIWSNSGKTLGIDVHRQRLAAGTVGGEHATPGSISGRALSGIVSPFDPRVSYTGTWLGSVGGDALDFLGEQALGTAPASTVTLQFAGTNVSVIGRTANYGGRADVYLDGVLQAGRVNTFTYLHTGSNSGLDNSTTSITVGSTTAFTSSGSIQIDGEVISYSSKNATHFLGCTRGASSTLADSHLEGSAIYQYSSLIEGYSANQQPRVTMWSNNNLPPGQHTLKLVVRSDTNASATATTLHLNCFVVGGAIGAANLITHLDYTQFPGTGFTSGYSNSSYPVSTTTTDQQILGIVGATAVSGGNTYYCGVGVKPVDGSLIFYCPQVGTGSADVTVTVSVLGAPL